MKKILLDTNAYSQLFRENKQILEVMGKADTVYISIFVLAELYIGFKGGKKESWNKDLLKKFLNRPHVRILIAKESTAEIFSELQCSLRKAGTPLPINDIWIAAHAIESGSTLITLDHHFKIMPTIKLWEFPDAKQ